jgi:hypothetical protein
VTKTQSLVLTGFTAAALGGALLYVAGRITSAADEDRPPIIVRGGSVIFESAAKNPRPGQPWTKENGKEVYHQDHKGKGRPVNTFQLYFVGGIAGGSSTSGLCMPVATTKFVVSYQEGTAGPLDYTVEIPASGNQDPTVSGPGITNDTTANTLTAGTHGQGHIVSVSGTDVNNAKFACDGPGEIWAESFNKK